MPFKSKAQMRYMFAKHPGIAEEFGSGMSPDSIKHLPEHLSDLGEKPKSMRQPSDINVKKNVEDANMDLDKFVRSGVLDKLIEDLQEMDFDKKLRPKMMRIEMHGIGGGGEGETVPAEGMEDDTEEEDVPEGMDPRLARLMKKKKMVESVE
jgi:hypothetical protein